MHIEIVRETFQEIGYRAPDMLMLFDAQCEPGSRKAYRSGYTCWDLINSIIVRGNLEIKADAYSSGHRVIGG